MNELRLVAVIAQRDTLRYTPAGVPVVNVTLLHSSQQLEAGMPRQVTFEVSAIAMGEISGQLNQAEIGTAFQFTGFLARRSRNSKSLVFHISDFKAHSLDDY